MTMNSERLSRIARQANGGGWGGGPIRLRDLPVRPEQLLRAAGEQPGFAVKAARALRAAVRERGGDSLVLELLKELEDLTKVPALCKSWH